jgi:hypothetical protein
LIVLSWYEISKTIFHPYSSLTSVYDSYQQSGLYVAFDFIDNDDKIECVAARPEMVKQELKKLFFEVLTLVFPEYITFLVIFNPLIKKQLCLKIQK